MVKVTLAVAGVLGLSLTVSAAQAASACPETWVCGMNGPSLDGLRMPARVIGLADKQSANGTSLDGLEVPVMTRGVQASGCLGWICGMNGESLNGVADNGTDWQGTWATGLRQPTDATQSTITAVILPTGESVDLR